MRRQRHIALLAAILVAPLLGVPVEAGAQSLEDLQEELDEVGEQRAATQRRLTEATQAFDDLESRIAELEQERTRLRTEVDRLREDLEEIEDLIALRVRQAFKHGSSLDPLAVFLSSDDATAALSRAETVSRVVAADRVSSEELLAVRERTAAAEQRLAERTEELEAARVEQRRVGEALQEDFERLRAREQELTEAEREERERIERERRERERREREERERRQRERRAAASAPGTSSGSSAGAASAPASGGAMACPLDHPRSFVDSWGAPRSGGRAHRGTDIMGPHGIPVRAIVDGVWVHQSVGASAGVWGILRGDNGDHYWYLHLSGHTVGSGARVSAGQQIGTNGSTGNATASAPHIHFELHPGGGNAVNPYSTVRQACG